MNLDDLKIIYFLGIGGIGMSALARYFNERGVEIHGYDKTETTLTKKLVSEGMKVHYSEPDLSKIPAHVDLVIWTPAIPRNFPEWLFFQNSNTPLKKRAEVLGIISRAQRTVAVAGTHGKTTTSSLVTHLLRAGGVDCTAFLGGISESLQSNYVGGKSDWVVVEADEYDRSFLHLSPEIAILLSMDPDHLDIYGEASKVAETGFKEFLKKVKPGGKVFINHALTQFSEKQVESPQEWTMEEVDYSTFGVEAGVFRAENIRVENGWFVFDFTAPVFPTKREAIPGNRNGENRSREGIANAGGLPEFHLADLKFTMPGRHNVENASAAIAVALTLGVEPAAIRQALADFKGIKRRFEVVFRDGQMAYIDDYAHHPTEIRSAVQAARELFPARKITGIFQPHLYSRTRDFQDGFAEELDKLDEIILMEIYPAREEPIPGITSEVIFEKMKNPQKALVTKTNVLEVLKTREIDVLMTIGAGDIDTFVEPIRNYLSSK
jgi:UDP-N-acetylmuramate--alanine ligase